MTDFLKAIEPFVRKVLRETHRNSAEMFDAAMEEIAKSLHSYSPDTMPLESFLRGRILFACSKTTV